MTEPLTNLDFYTPLAMLPQASTGAQREIGRSVLPMAVFGLNGEFLVGSDRWHQVLPPSPANIQSLTKHALMTPQTVAACRAGGIVATEILPIFDIHGQPRWVQLEVGPMRDDAGELVGLVGHCWDVTASVRGRQELERTEQRLTAALAVDRIVVQELDFGTSDVFSSGACAELGIFSNDFEDFIERVHPDDRDFVSRAREMNLANPSAEPYRGEFRLNDDKGTWVSTVSQFVMGDHGAPERILLVIQDISERVQQRQEVERLAFVDALTGLPNRARFQKAFEEACAQAEATGRPLGLVVVDVDHFKDINDTLGHDAGDMLLKSLAEQMRKVFRASDVVARLGGDEFAILLHDCGCETDLVRPLKALRKALAAPIQHRGQGFRISTSIGAALHRDIDDNPEHLLKNADIALYKAKEGGRDQVVLFEPQMRSEVEQRLELLRDVRIAITRGEFILFYQPVVSLAGDRGVAGFEALMRWVHPDHGVLTPSYFLAAFEDQDLSLQLGEVAIETALKQMRAWIDQGLEFGRVSINLSASQFRTGRLAKELRARLDHWEVPPDRLTVEVTENVYLGWGAELVAETVRELHACGVTIALDDFGTGYASLANLRQFPIDRLKIDKSFVQNADDEAIVRAVINLGASMGMEVVAEGVEKVEQLSALTRYGCDHVQGFHFARPMPASEVPGYLEGFNAAAGKVDAA